MVLGGGGEAIVGKDKTIADKLMYIPNVDKQNYPFFGLKLVVEIFKRST